MERIDFKTYRKLKGKKKGRINSKKIEYKGHKFDSKKEFKIFLEYEASKDKKVLELHPKFILLDKFFHGKNFIEMSFKPDFRVDNNGVEEIVEVKSKGTAKMTDYQMRKKLFLSRYPEINFREIIFDGNKRTENYYEGV